MKTSMFWEHARRYAPIIEKTFRLLLSWCCKAPRIAGVLKRYDLVPIYFAWSRKNALIFFRKNIFQKIQNYILGILIPRRLRL